MTPHEPAYFRVRRVAELQSEIPQRELAKQPGIRMGKANYLITALLEKGLIKIESFHRTEGKLNKIAYLLTPEGIKNRMQLTCSYLARKYVEYEALRVEIQGLRRTELEETPAHTQKPRRGGIGMALPLSAQSFVFALVTVLSIATSDQISSSHRQHWN